MKRMLICWVLLACSNGYAQAPAPSPPIPAPAPSPTPTLSISGPTSIPEHSLATLTVMGGSVTSVAWLVMPDTSTYQSGQTLTITGPPGNYTVVAFAVSGGAPAIFKATLTITPSIAQSNQLAIAIFDPSTLTSLSSGQAAIYQSATIGPALANSGVVWAQYQIGDVVLSKQGATPIGQTKWGQAALSAGLPALVNSVGGVISAVPLPADEATIVASYQIRGKR